MAASMAWRDRAGVASRVHTLQVHGDVDLVQSHAILRHLGRKYGAWFRGGLGLGEGAHALPWPGCWLL